MFLACLLVLALACIGLARIPTNAYWLLMLLRCLQAAGSASTIALGAGVIADIATRAERGSFFGLYAVGPMVSLLKREELALCSFRRSALVSDRSSVVGSRTNWGGGW